MLRVLRTRHRWGVSGTVITNGLVALKSLAEFLGLQPYSDAEWWKAHIGSATATAAANSGSKFGGGYRTSFKKRGLSSPEEEDEEAAAAEAAAAEEAIAVAQHERLGRLQDLARQHMWRTRQGDTKPMPAQKFLPPCRVRDEATLSEHRRTVIEGGCSDARPEFVFVLKNSAGVLIYIPASDLHACSCIWRKHLSQLASALFKIFLLSTSLDHSFCFSRRCLFCLSRLSFLMLTGASVPARACGPVPPLRRFQQESSL